MKNEYRKMMEQICLSDSRHAHILMQMEGAPKRKHAARPLRVAAIVACICLALVGGAFAAAHLSGVWLGEQVSGEEFSFYQVVADFGQWKLDQLGRELQEDLKQGTLRRVFNQREELEEYLGVQLIHSELLEQAGIVDTLEEKGWVLRPELAVDPDARYILSGMKLDGEEMIGVPEMLKVTAHRVVDNYMVAIDGRIVTENVDMTQLQEGLLGESFDAEPLIDWSVSIDKDGNPVFETIHYTSAEKIITSEPYVTANGLETTIVTAETVDRWIERQAESGLPFGGHGFREFTGYFVYEGILYSVHPDGIYDPTVEGNYLNDDALVVLKSILDSFK